MIFLAIIKQIFKHLKIIAIGIGSLLVIIACVIIYHSLFSPRLSPDAVVTQLHNLNRWETASYSIEKVIDKGSSQNKFSQILFGNRILLVAYGDVIAGFDLSTISPSSIQVMGSSITITLPPAQILSASLDEKKTYVYDREQGLLAPDNNLESQARLSAQNEIRSAACTNGIISKAAINGRTELTNILKGIGFSSIQIIIPQGSC